MAVLSAWRNFNEVSQMVNMEVNVSLATVATSGWLALPAVIADLENLNSGLWVWQPSDLVWCWSTLDVNGALFKVDLTTNSLVLYSTAGNGAVTLPVVANDFVVFDGVLGALKDLGFSASDPTKAKVVMAGSAVQANYIAHFIDTAGTIDDTAANIQNDGNIQAGKSGVAGNLISFPAAVGNGSLILSALNAGGAFNTTIRNSIMGQSSVISIPDPGTATSNFLLSNSAGSQTIATGSLILTLGNLTLSAGNIVVSLGSITASAGNIIAGSDGNAGHFQSFPAAAANGSLLLVGANAGGAFNTTISNGSMGQSTVYVIPDAGNANGRILVAATATPFTNGHLISASGTGGLTVDSGVVAANVQDKTNIVAATTANIGGAGAGPISVVVAGLTAASVVVGTIESSSNAVQVQTITATATGFDVTFSGDPGASCLLNYVAFKVAQ